MISRTDTITDVKPIYQEYLEYIRQFFNITHPASWRETAVKNLHRYAMAEDRHIYTLKVSGAVIGFALINQHLRFNSDGVAMAEFYIQKGHGRKGYGRQLAEHVFGLFSGHWEVAVTRTNTAALVFWEQVVSTYTKGRFLKKRHPSFHGYGFVFNTAIR
ncbi:GNAT family N-acetyltransferase [Desulfobacula sp.]|uniref:GNAT family N-acetyltransferase n=1 Tax=Desulfobacula sp. TaxID=2593537 RepID=UPI002616085E|nr:GNAT family N-acetyltransferase [Desulfobacula sp.]